MSALLAAMLALAAPLTEAPSPDPAAKTRAQALLTEGAVLYENGDAAGALEKFNAAYRAFPSPKLWLNIGQAHRDLGHPVRALEAFERFIAEVDDPPPEALAETQHLVAELQAQLGRVIVECPTAGAELLLDGRAVGVLPLGRPIWTTAGKHRLTVRKRGYVAAVDDIEVTAGRTQKRTMRLLMIDMTKDVPTSPGLAQTGRAAAPSAPQIQPDVFYRRWQFWTVMGGVLMVGAVIAIVSSGGSQMPTTTLGSQRVF